MEVYDCISLSRWSVWVGIGAYDHEQRITQELVLTLRLWGDFRVACGSDRLDDALDYSELKGRLEVWMSGRRWQLLEAFGDQLCGEALKSPLVRRVELVIEKPAALAPALVSYTLTRSK